MCGEAASSVWRRRCRRLFVCLPAHIGSDKLPTRRRPRMFRFAMLSLWAVAAIAQLKPNVNHPTNLDFSDGEIGQIPPGWEMAQPALTQAFTRSCAAMDATLVMCVALLPSVPIPGEKGAASTVNLSCRTLSREMGSLQRMASCAGSIPRICSCADAIQLCERQDGGDLR